jgi:hypothetical protein
MPGKPAPTCDVPPVICPITLLSKPSSNPMALSSIRIPGYRR